MKDNATSWKAFPQVDLSYWNPIYKNLEKLYFEQTSRKTSAKTHVIHV